MFSLSAAPAFSCARFNHRSATLPGGRLNYRRSKATLRLLVRMGLHPDPAARCRFKVCSSAANFCCPHRCRLNQTAPPTAGRPQFRTFSRLVRPGATRSTCAQAWNPQRRLLRPGQPPMQLFTPRALKDAAIFRGRRGARPTDGAISQSARTPDRIFGPKGHSYSLAEELLSGDAPGFGRATSCDGNRLESTSQFTVRTLAAPCASRWSTNSQQAFSVNRPAENVPRAVSPATIRSYSDTERGPMCVVLVGAMISLHQCVWVTRLRR